jgi:hypothetical protein
MRKLFVTFVLLLVGIGCVVNFASADSVRINDNYIGEGWNYWGNGGAGNTNPDEDYLQKGNDVISSASHVYAFDIHHMLVDITDNTMTVSVRTDYNPNASYNVNNTRYGDLFISTNGWTPDTEVWEYVFDVSGGKLYDVQDNQNAILTTDDSYMFTYHHGDAHRGIQSGTWRRHQEAWVDSSHLTAIGSGSAGKSSDNQYYTMAFDISGMGLSGDVEFGFHWTQTCANDVIEGSARLPVGTPEPSTVFLLGAGLAGVAAYGRKHFLS